MKRVPTTCYTSDRSKDICNGCDDISACKLTKRYYSAERAQQEYQYSSVDSREGINLTFFEISIITSIIAESIKNGQSVYAILQNRTEIKYCEKIVYNWIEIGAFESFGLTNISLQSKVGRKMKKKDKVKYKKREDKAYLKNRTYDCFEKYMKEHPSASFVEMDTVYKDESNGPFIQTFMIVSLGLMIAVYHTKKNAETMVNGLLFIKERLGDEAFYSIFKVLITDRGSEFSDAQGFEELVGNVYIVILWLHGRSHM